MNAAAKIEEARLAALLRYDVLDTPAEAAFDDITDLVAQLFEVPIAVVTLLDETRQWFKSCIGLDDSETARDVAFCDHTIRSDDVLVVLDATQDPRFRDNPFVVGDAHIRFYAGAPLITKEGYRLGALCAIDTEPRQAFDDKSRKALQRMATMVVHALDQRAELMLRRRAAQELATKEHTLELAEKMARLGHWRFDFSTQRSVWSSEAYSIHGVHPSQYDPNVTMPGVLYAPEDQPRLAAAFTRGLVTKEPFEFEGEVVRPDGVRRRVITRGAPEFDENGEIVALIGVIQDVTESRAMTEALRASEARYRLVAENANDLILVYDVHGTITFAAPSSAQILGYEPEEMVGRTTQSFLHPDDVAPTLLHYQSLLKPGGEELRPRVTMRARRKDGREIWLEAAPYVVRDENGRVLRFHDSARDVTVRKRYEAELQEARAQAEYAAGVKSDFLANMSHELRTPLTSIIGFSRLLEFAPELSSSSKSAVDRIAAASRALNTLVNDVLDLAKLEGGKVELDPQQFEVDPFLTETVELLRPQISAKGLELRLEIEPSKIGVLYGDTSRLRQVLLNMLSNAVKFTETGGVVVRSRVKPLNGPFACWELEVEDTGIGIRPEELARLFDRFVQADASVTRRFGGTGLGLAISRQLIDLMGGSIEVDSEPGRGSRFMINVRLPIHVEAGEAVPTAHRLKILVAEDGAANRAVIARLLEAMGHDFDMVADGASAIEAARSERYDVILMDVAMPDVDGLTATREILHTPGASSGAPIVPMSSCVGAEDRAEYAAAGMMGLIPKPITLGALADVLAVVPHGDF
ncbi:PAS domain S-box protein [Caulobacter sp. NIBR2454]|uniref:PAS domain S-box protein n=1 Tax=Caulobacter sp. NIBR2454 TaxID=3015996 RepID=UPI0022B6DCF4|nr:PAS domain S-box protein [Caulobacter sp. NIBR2454]